MANPFPNPGYEDTDMTAWARTGSGASTVDRVTTEARSGAASARVVTDAAAARQGIGLAYTFAAGTVPASVGQVWEVEVYAKGSGTVALRLTERSSANGFLGETISSSVALTGTWQPITVARTLASASVAKITVELSTTSAQTVTFYVDGWRRVLPSSGTVYPVLKLGFPHIGPLRVGTKG